MSQSTVILEVTADHIEPIVPPLGGSATVLNVSGSTLFYSDNWQVSPTNNQGSVTAGNSVTFTNVAWVASPGLSTVTVTSATSTAQATGGSSSSQVFSALAYGAVGDGVTDDKAAIQAAINAAGANYATTGAIQVLVFPSGYSFSFGQVSVVSGVRLWCYGALMKPNHTPVFNGAWLRFPNGGASTTLANFEICGGTWIGNGTEGTGGANGQIFSNGSTTNQQDVVVRDMFITNWGYAPLFFQNPTRVKVLNNTILSNEINNSGFQNAISFDFNSSTAAGGEILVDGNHIHNATADSIAVVVTSAASGGPMYYTVTNNLITADPPQADAGCTFNGTTLVLDPAASTTRVGRYVTGPGVPAPTLISSAVNGVSYTLNKASTFSGSGILYVNVRRNTIALELDSSIGASSFVIANNIVVGYERSLIALAGAAQNITQGIVANNVLTNGQVGGDLNWTNSIPQGSAIALTAQTTNNFDVSMTGNQIACTSPVAPISSAPHSFGVQSGNKFTRGAAQGRAVLVAGTVTVSTTEVQAADNIILSRVVAGGTLGVLSVGTITAGTSFVINSANAADTSTVYWKIDH